MPKTSSVGIPKCGVQKRATRQPPSAMFDPNQITHNTMTIPFTIVGDTVLWLPVSHCTSLQQTNGSNMIKWGVLLNFSWDLLISNNIWRTFSRSNIPKKKKRRKIPVYQRFCGPSGGYHRWSPRHDPRSWRWRNMRSEWCLIAFGRGRSGKSTGNIRKR